MSRIQLLFPCDVFSSRLPDEAYREEFDAAQQAGIPCAVFSVDDLEGGAFAPRLIPGLPVLYRGWMLNPERYARLQDRLEALGATVVTNAAHYQRCHHLPGWIDACRDLTPATLILDPQDDLAAAWASTGWQGCFVKDYVKSLTTSRGSVAHSLAEVNAILEQIADYRGGLEGGICLRELEHLLPETEVRYFVFQGRAHGPDGTVPKIVEDIVARIDSPFYSVDIVLDQQGRHRLVELGDGQVSDTKQWPINRFIQLFI